LLPLTADLSGQRFSDTLCKPQVSLSRQYISLFPTGCQMSIYLSIYVLLIFSGSLFVPGNYFIFMLSSCDPETENISRPFSVPFNHFNRPHIRQNEMRQEKIPKKLYIESWRPQTIGRFMAHSVSRPPLIADARV
jgi:hypothetical protein